MRTAPSYTRKRAFDQSPWPVALAFAALVALAGPGVGVAHADDIAPTADELFSQPPPRQAGGAEYGRQLRSAARAAPSDRPATGDGAARPARAGRGTRGSRAPQRHGLREGPRSARADARDRGRGRAGARREIASREATQSSF